MAGNLILDTNGASSYGQLPGGLGYDACQVPTGITSDGGTGFILTNKALAQKNLGVQQGAFSFYYRPDVRGSGGNPFWRCFITAGSPGTWLFVSQKNSGKISFTIQNGASSVASPDSTTVLATGTEYLIDGYVRADSTTWRMRVRISTSAGTVLETMAETSLTGQVATMIPELRTGYDSSATATARFRHCRFTDDWTDYPIGSHTSNDTESSGLTSYAPSWVANPSLIRGGILVGINAPYGGVFPAPYIPNFLAAEGATKTNRHVYAYTIDYTDVTPPPNLYAARRLLNGTMFGDGISRVPIISGLGFNGFTTDWPTNGLADFISGAMDATLQKWADLFLTLPQYTNADFIWRPWREMNSQGTIYGPNGAGVTPHAGRNETSSDFKTASQYLWDFMRVRVPNLRMAFCPQVGDGFGGLMSTAGLSAFYQSGAWQWVTPTGYVSSSARPVETAFANVYAGWNEVDGTVDLVPFGVSETQTDRSDATRISDMSNYTAAFTSSLPHTRLVNFWDCIMTCTYPWNDTPSGYLATSQTVVNSAPFLGDAASTTYTDTLSGSLTISGTRAESYTHSTGYSDAPLGSLSLTGSRSESYTPPAVTWPSPGSNGKRHGGGSNGRRQHELATGGRREGG